jgi:hypothetical protein
VRSRASALRQEQQRRGRRPLLDVGPARRGPVPPTSMHPTDGCEHRGGHAPRRGGRLVASPSFPSSRHPAQDSKGRSTSACIPTSTSACIPTSNTRFTGRAPGLAISTSNARPTHSLVRNLRVQQAIMIGCAAARRGPGRTGSQAPVARRNLMRASVSWAMLGPWPKVPLAAIRCLVCRHFERRERRDSNPRPPA